MHTHLSPADYAVLILCFATVVGIGWALERRVKGSADFLTGDCLNPVILGAIVLGVTFARATSHSSDE